MRESHQVDRNIDFQLAQELRHFPIAVHGDVDKPIERSAHPLLESSTLPGAQRDADHFESRTIVPLQHAHQQMRDRMVAEIG